MADWRDRAACKDAHNPEAWFTEVGEGVELRRAALKVCRSCPVQADCLRAGLEEPYGIWGGALPHQREQLRRTLRARRAAS